MSTRPRSRLSTFALAAVVVLTLALPAIGLAEDGKRPHYIPQQPEVVPAGERAAQIAVKAVGVPYRWGGESPSSGFDCSGLIRWAYEHVGIDLPHNSYALYGEGRRVSVAKLEPGDLLFFEGLGHVGLYLGRGRMVHAPQTGRNVEVIHLTATNYGSRLIGARRVTPA